MDFFSNFFLPPTSFSSHWQLLHKHLCVNARRDPAHRNLVCVLLKFSKLCDLHTPSIRDTRSHCHFYHRWSLSLKRGLP